MAQQAKIIDITKSFIPVDPNTYPANLHGTTYEDNPVDAPGVVAYKGQNFLPTAYGYKSFFGTNANLGINALTSKVDRLFIFQTTAFDNILVALCEDGIWTKVGETAGAWTHAVTLAIPETGQHLDWTYCIIGDSLYMYRANGAVYYKMSPSAQNYAVDSFAADLGDITTATGVGTTGLAAGTYKYRVAYKNSDGAYSAPSPVEEVVVAAANSWVSLTFTRKLTATGYRVYRELAGVIEYFDVAQPSSGTNTAIYDADNASTVVTLPDTTWEAVLYDAYEVQSITPTFLNMEGQHGVFKAGMRLGFWDSSNSVAWSSLDDLGDFTPSIETLAGSAIFGDVVGRIVNILPHGEGFIIYATRSIVHVAQQVSATFQWDSNTILGNTGIAFMEEVCSASPDTVHFAWTSSGMYKIQEGKEEVIIPEIFDFLKEMDSPMYLQVLGGRYLCLQLLEEAYVDGAIQTYVQEVPPTTITFPEGFTVDDIKGDPQTLTGNATCATFSAYDAAMAAGAGAAHAAAPEKPPKKADTFYTPIYRAYLSYGHAARADRIVWGPTPCPTVGPDAVEYNMVPQNDIGQVSRVTTDATNKAVVTDDPNSPATRWTPEKFVATQLAIWGNEEAERKNFLNAILARFADAFGPPTITTESGIIGETVFSTCDAYNQVGKSYCPFGTYIAEMSEPHWDFNSCSLWLTRYVTKQVSLSRVRADWTACSIEELETYWKGVNFTNHQQSPDEVCLARIESGAFGGMGNYVSHVYRPEAAASGFCDYTLVSSVPNPVIAGERAIHCKDIRKTLQNRMQAYNIITDSQVGIFAVDQAWLQLYGWTYTDENNQLQFIAANPVCNRPAAPEDPPNTPGTGGGQNTGNIPVLPDGTMCGTPFEPVTIPEISAEPITWPTQSVTIPGGSFLLQKGSIGPIYPTFEGAYVYDLHLKKWGKLKTQYQRLVDYSPINLVSGDIVPYDTFGVSAGCIRDDGLVYLFDQYPSNSSITYGKVGLHRLGYTSIEEVKANFVRPFNGFVILEGSLDGKNLELGITESAIVANTNTAELLAKYSARWYNITVSGIFDLTHLEFRGVKTSRR